MKPAPYEIPPTQVGLALLGFVPLLLISDRFVHFLPSQWWLENAFLPAVVLAVGVPCLLLVQKLRRARDDHTQSSGTMELSLLQTALAVFGGSIYIFLSVLITLPAILALLLGWTTTHQATAQTNIYGGPDLPQRGCRHRSVLIDRPSTFFDHLCFDNAVDKQRARNFGPQVKVNLYGWGNGFGIYYTSTDPIGPVDP